MSQFHAPKHFMSNMISDIPIKVVVVGAGGTGSSFLQKLLQLHTVLVRLGSAGLHVTVFDDDTVSETNIGRQAFYPMDVGLPKSQVLVERFNAFANTDWDYQVGRFALDSDHRHNMPDILVTCVDNPQTRAQIGKVLASEYQFKTILWLDGGNDANSGQVVLGSYPPKTSGDARLPSVYDLFKDSLDTADFEPTDSCSHEEAISKQDFGINDQISSQMIQILWRLLRHGYIDYHGVVVDMVKGEHSPMPVNPLNWQLMGFDIATDKMSGQ